MDEVKDKGNDRSVVQKAKLERLMPVGMEAQYVDQFLLQNLGPDMYILSLYQSEPLTYDEDDKDESNKCVTLRAYCRARLLLGPKQLIELEGVVKEHLEKERQRKVED